MAVAKSILDESVDAVLELDSLVKAFYEVAPDMGPVPSAIFVFSRSVERLRVAHFSLETAVRAGGVE